MIALLLSLFLSLSLSLSLSLFVSLNPVRFLSLPFSNLQTFSPSIFDWSSFMSNQDELCSSPVVQARKIKRSKKKPTVASLPIMLPLSHSLSLSLFLTHTRTPSHMHTHTHTRNATILQNKSGSHALFYGR